MDDGDDDPRVCDGQVKWFDPGRGFGFVISDQDDRDILLHANVLRNFGQGSVADGSGISVLVQETPRGLQAVEILSISGPCPDTERATLRDLEVLDPEELARAAWEPARVKWFDKTKGFGFANTFGTREDIFIHIELLHRRGLSDLPPGEAVAVRVVAGQRGLMAADLDHWEVGAADEDSAQEE